MPIESMFCQLATGEIAMNITQNNWQVVAETESKLFVLILSGLNR